MPSIAILTYGCTANQSQGEVMAGLLKEKGFGIADGAGNADAVVINSCIVKGTTENKVRSAISRAVERKKPLVIAGCITDRMGLRSIAPNASLINSHNVTRIADVVSAALRGERVEEFGFRPEPKLGLPRVRQNPLAAKMEISQGCLGSCAYCATRLAKGRLVSYPVEQILLEARKAVGENCKEILLTSQDCGCYGFDSDTSLPELLRAITSLPGGFRVRVGMMNPDHASKMRDGLIPAYESEKMYRFLHLPVQSGSDSVLERMCRGYDSATFASLCDSFRNGIRDLNLATDVIVGFPGETDDDFEKTLRLVEGARPDITNVSRFAPRPGTPAAGMKKLDTSVAKRRSGELSAMCRKIGLERNEGYLGRELRVLITERHGSGFLGRAPNYKQVLLGQSGLKQGDFAQAEIIGASPYGLLGKI